MSSSKYEKPTDDVNQTIESEPDAVDSGLVDQSSSFEEVISLDGSTFQRSEWSSTTALNKGIRTGSPGSSGASPSVTSAESSPRGEQTGLTSIDEEEGKHYAISQSGFFWGFIGVTLMSFMAMGCKLVKIHTDHNFVKVAFVRSMVMAIGAYSHGRFLEGIKPCNLSKPMIHILNKRSLWGTLAYFFQLWAITLMPISLAMVLYYSQPVFTSVLSFVLNGERISKLDTCSILFSLLGIIVITDPEAVMRVLGQASDDSGQIHEDKTEYPYYFWGACAAVFGAFSSGMSWIYLRRIGTQIHSSVKPMYFGFFCGASCFLVQVGTELLSDDYRSGKVKSQLTLIMPLSEFALIFFTGVFGWLAQEALSKAISIEKAGRIAALNYLQIVFYYIFDITYMERSVHWTDLVGTLSIVFFAFLGKVNECRKSNSNQQLPLEEESDDVELQHQSVLKKSEPAQP